MRFGIFRLLYPLNNRAVIYCSRDTSYVTYTSHDDEAWTYCKQTAFMHLHTQRNSTI